MPIFETPEPISVTIELGVGDLRITASDRTDTLVEVRPSDASDQSDVAAAEQTRVDYANGLLVIKAPKSRAFDFSKKTRSVDVSIELPSGSQVHGDAAMVDVRGIGRLGKCRVKTSMGQLQLEQTGPAWLHTGFGHVTVDRVGGDADVSTGSGNVRLGEINGAAIVKNSNGSIGIGLVTGVLQARTANGDITIDRAAGTQVEAKTANGPIRLGEAVRGSVVLKTAAGDLAVGVAPGTAAWLDVHTSHGRLRNSLDGTAAAPGPAEETVEVHAHTSYGDITIHRSQPASKGSPA